MSTSSDDDEVVKVRFEGYLLQPTEIENDRIRKIHVTKLSEEELAARKAKWQPREPKVTTGYLARYAALVTSGNRGAILEVPKTQK